MKRTMGIVAAIAVAGTLWAWVAGCQTAATKELTLDRAQPETRERMERVMENVGRYYDALQANVAKDDLLQAATSADAIAALGSYLAPYRDPGVPKAYLAMQADFDESAREVALAARLAKTDDLHKSISDLEAKCRQCHEAFAVTLAEPHAALGASAPWPNKAALGGNGNGR